jgi:spoIIIJ-associated protein
MGVGAVDAIVEVALADEVFDFYGPGADAQPAELLVVEPDDEYDEVEQIESEYGEFVSRPESGEEPSDSMEAARLRFFLRRVLAELGLAAQVRISESSDELRAEISGEDLGILIGRRGQTIDAVEYLASIAVFQGGHTRRKHVELDAEGYKERRRRQIERMALRKAQEAAKRGRPVELAPMSPAERKIVHLSLKGRTDVVTESQGREPNRSVVISPVR